MEITKEELQNIIKEELADVLDEKRKKAGTESSKESSLRDWFGRKGAKGKTIRPASRGANVGPLCATCRDAHVIDGCRASGYARGLTGGKARGVIDAIGGEAAAIDWMVRERDLPDGLPVQTVQTSPNEDNLLEKISGLAGKSLFSNALTLDGLVSLWQPSAR